MRKLLLLFFALFIALQGAMASARDLGTCCDTCHDAMPCATASCTACPIQATSATPSLAPPWLADVQAAREPLATLGRTAFEIWKPPRESHCLT